MISKKLIIGILFIALAIILTNCEKMPNEKLGTAKSLIIKMTEQEVSTYAPEKYAMAMNFYNKATKYIGNKDYKKANVNLDQFINTANSALVKAQNEKELEEIAKKNNTNIQKTDSVEQSIVYEENNIQQKATPESKYIEETSHFVVTGDCLSEISMIYYGTSRYWYDIYKANPNILSDPGIIKTGQTLRIPAIYVELITKSIAPEQLKEGEYLVEIGESLWNISNKVYPNELNNRWKLIYNFNQDKLDNPNFLRAGIILNIPSLDNYTYSIGDSTYHVQNGDNLWKIAEILNESDTTNNYTWQDLFEINQSVIDDSNMVYPDQVIKLK